MKGSKIVSIRDEQCFNSMWTSLHCCGNRMLVPWESSGNYLCFIGGNVQRLQQRFPLQFGWRSAWVYISILLEINGGSCMKSRWNHKIIEASAFSISLVFFGLKVVHRSVCCLPNLWSLPISQASLLYWIQIEGMWLSSASIFSFGDSWMACLEDFSHLKGERLLCELLVTFCFFIFGPGIN